MPAYSGTYSRLIFDEAKRALGILQEASTTGSPRPWVDADYNDWSMIIARQMQRIVQHGFGDGSPNEGFRIDEAAVTTNDFSVHSGGDGDIETAGRMWVGGLPAFLEGSIDWADPGDSQSAKLIHHVSTGLTATVLTDTSVRFVANALVGRKLVPDALDPATNYTIVSNTETTITTAGDMLAGGAALGDAYYVALSTPSVLVALRVDTVVLDVYLDEVRAYEDDTLDHGGPAGAGQVIIGANRLRATYNVFVNQAGAGYYVDGPYTDLNGMQHWMVPLASIARIGNNANVTTAMLTDLRTQNWGMGSVRSALVGPDHTAISLLRRTEERTTWITVGDGVTTFGDYNGEDGLRAAAADAPTGSAVWVKPGTYTLTAAILPGAGKDLVIRGGGEQGIAQVHIVKLAGSDAFTSDGNLTLENLYVTCTGGAGYGVNITGGELRLRDVKFASIASDYAVKIAGAGLFYIERCSFNSGNAVGGVLVANTSAGLVSRSTIDNCTFSLGAGVDATDCGIVFDCTAIAAFFEIRNCRFLGAMYAGIRADSDSATDVLVEHCIFNSTVKSGIELRERNDRWTVRDCQFEAGISDGMVYAYDNSGLNRATLGFTLENCWFGDPGAIVEWVRLANVISAKVLGNRFVVPAATAAPVAAILNVNSPTGTTDSQNLVEGNTFSGETAASNIPNAVIVGALCARAVVRGNSFINLFGATGISVLADDVLVADNDVRDCDIGIDVVSADHVAVRGNNVTACAGLGVQLADSDHAVVAHNKVYNNNGSELDVQIDLTDSADSLVSDNNCVGTLGDKGKIDGSTASTSYKGNLAEVQLKHATVLPPYAILPRTLWAADVEGDVSASLLVGNQWATDEYLVGVGMVGGTDGVVVLHPGLVPDGAILTDIDVRVSLLVNATNEIEIFLYSHTYTTATVGGGSATVTGVLTEQDATYSPNEAIDYSTKSYYVRLDLRPATAEADAKIFAVRFRWRPTR